MDGLTIIRNEIISNAETRNFLADVYHPAQGEKFPVVIFAHGYKGYKDWGAWDLMAQEIANAGFLFIKFNFSHNGTTVEDPKNFADLEAFGQNNFSKELSDYEKMVSWAADHPKAQAEKIGIVGHSRGGGITVIQAYEDERIKAAAVLAGVSNFRYRFPSQQRFDDWKQSGVMYSENKRTGQQMPHYFQFFEDFERHEQRFDIQYAAQHLEKPFLIIQGTEDEAVKDKEATLLHEWAKQSELLMLEGANHTFGAKEPWTEDKLPEDLKKAASALIKFFSEKL